MTRSGIVMTLVGLLCSAIPAAAQTRPSPEAIQKMLEPMRPVAEHQELAALAGRWTQEVTYSMGGPPMKASGMVTNRMILGGRFLVSEGSSPNPAGPGAGDPTVDFMSIYGFDRRTKEFTIITLDTMGTYYVTAAGNRTEPRTIVMRGETLDDHGGSTPGKEMRKYDMVLKFVDADTYVTEIIFHFPGRTPQTVVSVTHRRLK
jgi:hypothetical protein